MKESVCVCVRKYYARSWSYFALVLRVPVSGFSWRFDGCCARRRSSCSCCLSRLPYVLLAAWAAAMATSPRVHPSHYPQISEPVSPSERSTATGYSFHPNYQPLKAYTTPGYDSPPRPPPTEVGRPPIKPRKPRRRSCRTCCKRCLITTCSLLLILLFVLGLAALIIWIVFKPKIPQYSVEDVVINKLNVTSRYDAASRSLQATDPTLVDTDITFTLYARNPNEKIRIDYKKVSIQTMFQGSNVGQAVLPGWYQEAGNTTTIRSDILATKAPLSVTQGASLLVSIQANDVPLDARIDTRVAIKIGAWRTPAVWIHVNCNFHVAPPTAPGGAKLLSKSCKWKWRG